MSMLDALIFGVRTWIFGSTEMPQRSKVKVTGAITLTDDSVNAQTVMDVSSIGNSNLAGMPATTIKANVSGSAAAPIDATPAQIAAILPAFGGDSGSGGSKGGVPAPSAGDAAANKVLGAGGGWVTQSGGSTTIGVVTVSGTTYTLLAANIGKEHVFTSNSNVAVTVEKSATIAYTVGAEYILRQSGNGQITVTPTSPAAFVDLVGGGTTVKSRDKGSAFTIWPRSTDVWVAMGDYV